MKKLYLLVFIAAGLIFASCQEKETVIKLDENDSLALSTDIEWAVIDSPFVSFRKEKDYSSEETYHAKKGEIFQIKGYFYSDGKKEWISGEHGYIPVSAVKIYSNKYQAEAAARKVTEK